MDKVFTEKDKANVKEITGTLHDIVNLLNSESLDVILLKEKTKTLEDLNGFSENNIPYFYLENYVDHFDKPLEERTKLVSNLRSFTRYVLNKEEFDNRGKLNGYKKVLVELELLYIRFYNTLLKENI